ncbi:MAG: TRAP transporter large permease subunit [Betaproteobacteria bacterium]
MTVDVPIAAPTIGLAVAEATDSVFTVSAIERVLGNCAVALLAAGASVALLQVFCRYVLNASLSWPEELAQWMFVWAVFVGAGLFAGHRGHIAIQTFSPRLAPPAAAMHAVIVDAFVALGGVILLGEGISFVAKSTYVSPGLGWSFKFLYAAVPVGGALTLACLARARLRSGAVLQALAPMAIAIALYVALLMFGTALPVEGSAIVLMVVALALIALEVPIAFAFVVGTFAAFVPQGDLMLVTIPQNMGTSLNSFTLLAIPFFILAASLMNAAGITTRLVDLASAWFGHLRGGLGHVNVATNTMMAGISGSSMADAAAIGKILVPEMRKRGYSPAFACALTSASATLANLIPPSLGLIIYGALAQASVGALFVATIVPGLLTAAALAITVHFCSGGRGSDLARTSSPERRQAFVRALPALLLPIVIVGGVRFGIFTATESGAIATFYALACGALFYRVLTMRLTIAAAREALHDTVAVAFIIAAAAPFAWTLSVEQAPQKVAVALGGIAASPILLLMLINVFLLVVGLFMEMIAAMVILVPILVPIVKAAGIDPVHFGVVLVMNLVLGALTPPMGMLAFTTARVGNVPVVQVFRALLPFMAGLLLVLLMVSYIPALTTGMARQFGP